MELRVKGQQARFPPEVFGCATNILNCVAAYGWLVLSFSVPKLVLLRKAQLCKRPGFVALLAAVLP